jgi:outer membrane protein assembly factor BamD (BamD/ComL family)
LKGVENVLQYKWILILFMALISVRCATTGADWETSRKLNTVCGYQVFLKNHPESEYISDAKVRIEELEWQKTKTENSYKAYKKFLRHYPQSKHAEEAKEEVEWEIAHSKDTIEAYKYFLDMYPHGKYAEEAGNNIETQVWETSKNLNTNESYRFYLKQYPNGRFIRDAEKVIQLKKRIADCKAVSQNMANQIEREVANFIGIEQDKSLIINIVDFKLSMIGLSDKGVEVDLTNYVSTEKKGEILNNYFISNNELSPEESMEIDRDGKWYKAKKVVRYKTEITAGSTILIRDGRIFTYLDGQWHLCPR